MKQKRSNMQHEFCAKATHFDKEYGFASKKGFIDIKDHIYDSGPDDKGTPKISKMIPKFYDDDYDDGGNDRDTHDGGDDRDAHDGHV
ncbi:hypothetical protein HNY73_020338 [Argiope bruennichi]|uniref:Uncharacterized protein n=1 Tax=Argiope bruennichi TaxID=94029 RepID=A0A8T0E6E2_ARGBR|nr:hypothetical protein HNY73_020338 [Argiope bruennichi]